MQFYIIHEDPKTNVQLLPEYALKKVNIREGWQILSDIGHIHGVSWPKQNKIYSASHVLTRSFCVNLIAFDRFMLHYIACAEATKGSYYDKLMESQAYIKQLYHTIPLERTQALFNLEYLLFQKRKQITDQDYVKLSKYRATLL